MKAVLHDRVVPEVVRYFRHGRYILGEVHGQTEAIVLARVIGPKSFFPKVVNLQDFRRRKKEGEI
mgnify:CR=1 FL=1